MKLPHKKTLKYYSDAGHEWVAVKREFLVELGILNSITPYSYQRGASVYLECDLDYTTFLTAAKAAGYEFYIVEMKPVDRSPIRSYQSFSA